MTTDRKRSPASPDPQTARFKALAEEMSALLNSLGTSTKPYLDPAVPHCRRAAPAVRARGIEYLEANLRILRECLAAGENPRESARFVWRGLQMLKLTPEGDIFDRIENDDVVEVYALDSVQIFRNIRFFEISTFTIEDILCRPWYHLTRRPWRIFLATFRQALRMRRKKITRTESWSVPAHLMDEVDTEGKIRYDFLFKYRSPVRRDGDIVGIITTARCVPLGSWNQLD